LPEEQINPGVLRQDQRYLSQSMRRLTGLVSVAAIVTAVVVFLIFPRGTGANMLGPMPLRANQSLTGFSDQLSFEQIASITQNTQTVGWVQVWKDGQPYVNAAGLYLRGSTLDSYEGSIEAGGWHWSRTGGGRGTSFGRDRSTIGGTLRPEETLHIDRPLPPGAPVYRQVFTLLPTNTPTIFAMPFPLDFTAKKRQIRVRYSDRTNTLATGEPLVEKIEYVVQSSDAFIPMTEAAFGG
jgi:hypothetical protein